MVGKHNLYRVLSSLLSFYMPLSLKLEGAAKAQMIVSLAALVLNDSKIELTADNLNTGRFYLN